MLCHGTETCSLNDVLGAGSPIAVFPAFVQTTSLQAHSKQRPVAVVPEGPTLARYRM